MAKPTELQSLLASHPVGSETVALCEWLETLDWDFRRAAALRQTEPRSLYREWLAGLSWNQSLAARLYRKSGAKRRGVTRQAIEAQMRSFGVMRPLELEKQLATQDVEGVIDAMRAVQRYVGQATSPERLCCELLLSLSDTWRSLGAIEEARNALIEVIKLARRLESSELAGRAMRALPYLLFQTSRYGRYDPEFIDVLESWAPQLRDLGDREALALCLSRLGYELYGANRSGSRERALQLTKEAVEVAREGVTPRTSAIVTGCRIVALSGPEHLQERLALLAPIVAQTRGLPADDRYFALDMLLTDLLEAGRVEETAPVRSELRGLEEQCSAPWPQRYRVTLAILEGNWSEAQRLSKLAGEVPMDSAAQVRGLQQYEALKLRGEWDDLAGLLRWSASQQPEFIGYRFCLAQIACLQGRLEGVERELDEWAQQDFACVPTDFLRVANLCILAEICHAVDRADHAETLHRLLAPYAERVAVVRVTAAVLGSVARYLALLESTLERWTEAERHFEQAMRVNRALAAGPYLAWTALDYAQMLRRAGGDRRRAADLARFVSGEASALQMSWLVERARPLIHPS